MTRLWTAMLDGFVLGAKATVALLVVGGVIGFALGDYRTVRKQAAEGAAAFKCLNTPACVARVLASGGAK